MNTYNLKRQKERPLPGYQLSVSTPKGFFAPRSWIPQRAFTACQSPLDLPGHGEGAGAPTPQMGSPRLGGGEGPRCCRSKWKGGPLSPVRSLFRGSAPSAPCAPLPTTSTSVHPASPSLHLAENRRLTTACASFLYPPFPRGGGWFGQSCLSDVSQSADFASCLRLPICGYSESNWLAAIRSKLVIQGEKGKKKKKPKLLNK